MRLLFLFFLSACGPATHFQNVLKGQTLKTLSYSQSDDALEKESFDLKNQSVKLDILVAPDASESMYHRLDSLGSSLSDLLSVIPAYDWQLAFTSVDHGDYNMSQLQEDWRNYSSDGRGRYGTLMALDSFSGRVLSPRVSNYESIFFKTLSHNGNIECNRAPFCSNPLEQPLRSLKSAIQRAYLDNRDFFRDSADFVSIIITNEEERKEDPKRATSPEEVVRAFEQQFSHLKKRFMAFNIIIQDRACLKTEQKHSASASQAFSIARLADLTGGANVSLCSQDYGVALKKISQRIKTGIQNTVILKKEPVPSSVQVLFLKGPELKFKVDGRRIVFQNTKGQDLSISVLYEEKK